MAFKKFKFILLSAATLAINGSAALSAFASPASKDFVYVESNIAFENENSVLGFHLTASGTLEALPGAPYLTGGKGVVDPSFALGPFDSDQNLITNHAQTLLFAVNSGSNSIAVFHIGKNGSLSPVAGSPFPSHGSNPVSLGLQEGILTVVNKSQDPNQCSDSPPNYTNFFVLPGGTLIHIGGSTQTVAKGSSPSQALSIQGKRLVFGADFQGGLLESFRINDDGGLNANEALKLPPSEFSDPNTPRLPLGLWAHPKQPILYVGFVTANKLGVYRYDAKGRLSFVRTVLNSGVALCWIRADRSGKWLYTVNTGDQSISVYDLRKDPSTPVEVQHLVLSGEGGPTEIGLSQDEKTLYVLRQRDKASIPQGQGNAIDWFAIDPSTGMLNEASGSPFPLALPGDTRPQGIVTL